MLRFISHASTTIGKLHIFKNTFYLIDNMDLRVSNDSGVTWPIKQAGVYWINTLDSELFIGKADGIMRSTDRGITWAYTDSLLSQCYANEVTKCGKYIFTFSNRHGISRSSDKGQTWHHLNVPFPNNYASIFKMTTDGDTICASGWGTDIVISKDFGQTWTQLYLGGGVNTAVKRSNKICATDTWGKVHSSFDNGLTWSITSVNIPMFGFRSMIVKDSSIFAVAGGNAIGVWRSDDFGLTWSVIQTTINGLSISCDSNKLYISCFFGEVYASYDNGVTWNIILQQNTGSAGLDVKARGNEIWTSTEKHGIFYSNNSGLTWDTICPPLTKQVYSLCITDSFLYAGTDLSVWNYKFNYQASSISSVSNESPAFIFPNPSSGIFTINLKNKTVETKICVYNVLGICILSQQSFNSLSQQIDISKSAKGIYFVEIFAEGKRSVKKIILE